MSNINITVELCQEDRKRIDELIGFAGLLVTGTKPAPEINHPADILPPHGDPEPAAEPAAEPELPKYTKDDIQAKVRKLAAPGSSKRLEAKAIVQEYAAKVSDIPEDKYTEVMMKLIALEG